MGKEEVDFDFVVYMQQFQNHPFLVIKPDATTVQISAS